MLFKQKPLLVVLLLIIIFTFAFLASVKYEMPNVVKENFDNDDVPRCTSESVPGCYATVMDESIWDEYGFENSEDYLLKTEIVPPVCPACPSVINQHSHDGVVGEEGQRLSGSEYKETNITNINNEENVFNENVENVESEVIIQEGNDNKPQQQQQQQQQQNNNQQQISNSLLEQYEKTISDLRGQISNLKQSNGGNTNNNNNSECAPCPAPMRCPEPAFSCQKVINYKSPSAGQYLPMPVLNDFSTFKDV